MLKVGQIEQVRITDYTAEGEGVCRVEGCVVFVPGAIRGELCRIRITHVGRTNAHGEIREILEPSPHRCAAECPDAARCGGCKFWHMDYEAECALKAGRVRDALQRLGGVELNALSILGGDAVERRFSWEKSAETCTESGSAVPLLHYRNKAQFPVQQKKGRVTAGFFRERTHDVIPIRSCLIQDAAADQAREIVLQWAKKYNVSAYDEKSHTGLLRHIYVRKGFASGQVMVCLVVNGPSLPREDALVERLRWGIRALQSVVLCDNRAVGNVVLSDRFRTLFGTPEIEDTLCGLRFRLSPRSFYQVNHDQAERLYEKAIRSAGLTGNETVIDLYCGTGTITLIMARQAGRVIGVEIIPQAIEDAKENARRNGIENAEFICADASQAAAQLAAAQIRPDVLCVDPPRKGLTPEVIDAIAEMAPQRVVYVSCDPATLARDVKRLSAHGYTLTAAEAVDMFPKTAHVETVVQLSKGERSSTPLRVELDGSDVDFAALREDATYPQIKNYVQEHFGIKVTSLQIAQTKRKYGLPVGFNYNVSKKENQIVPQCPSEKEEAIRSALRYFGLLC